MCSKAGRSHQEKNVGLGVQKGEISPQVSHVEKENCFKFRFIERGGDREDCTEIFWRCYWVTISHLCRTGLLAVVTPNATKGSSRILSLKSKHGRPKVTEKHIWWTGCSPLCLAPKVKLPYPPFIGWNGTWAHHGSGYCAATCRLPGQLRQPTLPSNDQLLESSLMPHIPDYKYPML